MQVGRRLRAGICTWGKGEELPTVEGVGAGAGAGACSWLYARVESANEDGGCETLDLGQGKCAACQLWPVPTPTETRRDEMEGRVARHAPARTYRIVPAPHATHTHAHRHRLSRISSISGFLSLRMNPDPWARRRRRNGSRPGIVGAEKSRRVNSVQKYSAGQASKEVLPRLGWLA